MRGRRWWRAVAWALLWGAAALRGPDARAEDLDAESARAVEALHPFGVRGLATAFEGSAAAGARPEAIRLALDWLAVHQTPQGTWRAEELFWCRGTKRTEGVPEGAGLKYYETGITGMTVAAFLGAGYTHRGKHPHAGVVRKALTWLVAHQDREGCVGPRNTQLYVYNHAFATLALVEAYALTGDAKLRGPAQKAIDFSALCRNPHWAWRYGVKPGDNDTSVTGCMGTPLYVALRLNRAAARAGMLEPLGLDDTVFDGIRNWLTKVTDEGYGRVGYIQRGTGPARPQELVDEFPGDKSESCTAIAVLMRQLLPGWDTTKEAAKKSRELIEKGLGLMLELKPSWNPGGGTIDLYYWYYATMAMRQAGGKAWAAWDDALATAVLNNQRRDGDACGVKGSWDPVGVWAKKDGGRIYATALCALLLETPDRMRPLPEDRTDLLEALKTPIDEPTRVASILRGLAELRVPGAGSVAARWIDHEDALISAAAIEALGRMDAGRDGVARLGAMLEDKRLEVRRAVVHALAAQGALLAPLVEALAARLGDEDAEVAAGAARALGHSGVAAAAEALRSRLAQGDLAVRVAAAAGLERLAQDHDAARPVLIAGLGAKAADVRIEAARALEALPGDPGPARKALLDALVDPDLTVRVHAAGALSRTGTMEDACVGAWISALDAPAGRVRLLAMQRLEKVGAARAVEKLRPQLLTGSVALRIQAAAVLRAAGPAARAAAPVLSWCSVNGPSALRKTASDAFDALELDANAAREHVLPIYAANTKDTRVLEGAARALVFQGAAIVPALADRLAVGTPAEKGWMLEILRRLGREAARAATTIARELGSTQNRDHKRLAARALAAIGPGAASTLPALRTALQDKDRQVREAAIQAVGELAVASDEAVTILRERAADTGLPYVRVGALRAMGKLGKRGTQVVPDLLQALDDANEAVRSAAVDALDGLWEHVDSWLLKILPGSSPRVRNGIAQVVARHGPEARKFVKPLAEILETGNFSGTSAYAEALAAIGKKAVSGLVKLLKSPYPKVRREAARALGLIGHDARRALRALGKLEEDADARVRSEAKRAIDRISRK